MHTRNLVLIIVAAIIAAAFCGATRQLRGQPGTSDSQQAEVEHGQYIVHHVAMCIQCHTPRNKEGVLDGEQLLQGAPIPVDSPFAGQRWAFQAPRLAALPGGWSEEQLIRFLQTGETISGRQPLPPMPPFRMSERDAAAVAAYLKSLQ
jgi:mono/diheme cytochrome c family protein